MGLQAVQSSGGRSGITPGHTVASALGGLNLYWSQPHESHLLDWKKWLELFTVAMMAKHSVSLSELTWTEGAERMASPMGGISKEAASRKVISILFFPLAMPPKRLD